MTRWECPRCGFEASKDDPPNLFRPWHIRGPKAVREYVESLSEEAHEWLLVLFVDEHMQLLAVDTAARGDIASCLIPFNRIFYRGQQLGAKGFTVVHNHPSGDPTPSEADVRATVRIARIADALNFRMFGHYVIAEDGMREVGYW